MPELPHLCPDHRPVIRAAAEKDHVGDEDSLRLALEYARQCRDCRSPEQAATARNSHVGSPS